MNRGVAPEAVPRSALRPPGMYAVRGRRTVAHGLTLLGRRHP